MNFNNISNKSSLRIDTQTNFQQFRFFWGQIYPMTHWGKSIIRNPNMKISIEYQLSAGRERMEEEFYKWKISVPNNKVDNDTSTDQGRSQNFKEIPQNFTNVFKVGDFTLSSWIT